VTKIISLTVVNLVTPKAGAKHELLFNKPTSEKWFWSHFVVILKSDVDFQQNCLRGQFVVHPSQTQVAQQGVIESIAMTVMKLARPKAAAKHELLINKTTSEDRGWFIEPKLMLSSSFICVKFHSWYRCDFGHILLCYLSQTWMCNNPPQFIWTETHA